MLVKLVSNVNKMNGLMIDGSWELRVLVTDLQVERTLRVKSELHIGGVMIQLVDELGKFAPAAFCTRLVHVCK